MKSVTTLMAEAGFAQPPQEYVAGDLRGSEYGHFEAEAGMGGIIKVIRYDAGKTEPRYVLTFIYEDDFVNWAKDNTVPPNRYWELKGWRAP